MFIAGIDEAGRGPVIGPMVVAVVKITGKVEKKLTALGVADSKKLLPMEREWLAGKIRQLADFVDGEIISAQEIDERGLTQPELDRIVALLGRAGKVKKIIIDRLGGLNSAKAIKYLRDNLKYPRVKIICEPKADKNYPVVAAASIVAKVTRDEEIKKIYEQTGRVFGSGYPNQKTYRFLKEYEKKYNVTFPQLRKRWKI